jgi:hypothetical protein
MGDVFRWFVEAKVLENVVCPLGALLLLACIFFWALARSGRHD